MQQFLPLFAAWWPLFIFREYLDASGSELLHVFRGNGDNLLLRALVLWGLYSAVAGLPFIVYARYWEQIGYLYLAVTLQGLFFGMLAYCLAMWSRNTFLPLLACVLICVYTYLFPTARFSPFDYVDGFLITAANQRKLCILLGLAVTLGGTGYLRERRLYR